MITQWKDDENGIGWLKEKIKYHNKKWCKGDKLTKTMKTSKENTEAALLCDNIIYDTIYKKDNEWWKDYRGPIMMKRYLMRR